MPGGFGPRFLLEALFLVLVAVVAGLSDLPTRMIVLVMFAAWLLTAGVEWAASRERARAARDEQPIVPVVEEAEVALPTPRRRLWRRARPEPEAAAEVEVEPPVTPPHIRVIPREPDPAAQPVLERPAPEPAALVDGGAAPEPDSARKPSPAVRVERSATERAVTEPPAEVPAEAATEAPTEAPGALEAGAEAPLAPAVAEVEPPPEPEPEPQATEEAPRAPVAALAAVPEPEPEPEPPTEPEAHGEEVTALPLPAYPRQWNVWDLERLTREEPGVDADRTEELSYLLMYLRDYARPDGVLPVDFDPLVRESFGELLSAAGSR